MSLERDSQPSVNVSNSAFCLAIGSVIVHVMRPPTARERLLDKVPEDRQSDVKRLLRSISAADLWFAVRMETLVLDSPTGVQRKGLLRDYLTLVFGVFALGGVALFFASHVLTPHAQKHLEVTLTFIFAPLLVLLGIYRGTHRAQVLGKRAFECHQKAKDEE